MSRFFIKTFGCQMNEYDSAKMADTLCEFEKMEPTNNPAAAELVVLNTCAVREKSQEKLFGELGRLREYKLANPNMLIGVAGCVASQEGAAIIERAPYVDLIFGPQAFHRLPQLIKRRKQTGKPQLDLSFPLIEKFDSLPAPTLTGPRAYVSIMEGCSKYCSFCVVPYTRGPELSRPVNDVLDEIAELVAQGCKEVTLLGQNVNAYAGIEPNSGTADLARLLKCIAGFDEIKRIRYTTSHPVNFSDRLIEAHRTTEKLVPHVHLPVQSGDDLILAKMKRGYTVLEYKSIIRRLRVAVPSLSLTSDFIVGFPGETEEQFSQTLKLVEDVVFDGGYTFIYSARPGTPAADLPDEVPEQTKKERLYLLQELLNKQFVERHLKQIGTQQQVLVEGPDKYGKSLTGKTLNNWVVNFSGDSQVGDLVNVLITSCGTFSLRGKIITT